MIVHAYPDGGISLDSYLPLAGQSHQNFFIFGWRFSVIVHAYPDGGISSDSYLPLPTQSHQNIYFIIGRRTRSLCYFGYFIFQKVRKNAKKHLTIPPSSAIISKQTKQNAPFSPCRTASLVNILPFSGIMSAEFCFARFILFQTNHSEVSYNSSKRKSRQ